MKYGSPSLQDDLSAAAIQTTVFGLICFTLYFCVWIATPAARDDMANMESARISCGMVIDGGGKAKSATLRMTLHQRVPLQDGSSAAAIRHGRGARNRVVTKQKNVIPGLTRNPLIPVAF